MHPGPGINQLPGNPNLSSSFPNAAFEDITHTEFSTDLLHVHGPALVGEARIAGDDEQVPKMGQRSNDILDHTVGEVFLLRISAHVLKGQHRDGRLVGKRKRPSLAPRRTRLCLCGALTTKVNPPRSHGLGNVLEGLRPKVIAGDLHFTSNLPIGVIGYTNACLLYTSDAADDLLCVDLGGR